MPLVSLKVSLIRMIRDIPYPGIGGWSSCAALLRKAFPGFDLMFLMPAE